MKFQKYAEEVAFDYVKKMAWDWNSKTGQNKQLVEYYAALNDLTFEKANSLTLTCFTYCVNTVAPILIL